MGLTSKTFQAMRCILDNKGSTNDEIKQIYKTGIG